MYIRNTHSKAVENLAQQAPTTAADIWRACHSRTGTTTRRRRRHGDDGRRRLREAGEDRDVHALLRDLQLAANVQVLPLVLRAVHRQAQARQDKQVAAARLQVSALPQVMTPAP